MNGSLLIVDDERSQQEILATILAKAGYYVEAVGSAKEAERLLEGKEYDIILSDLKMDGMSGMDLLKSALTKNPQQCVIMMTAHGSVNSAVEAIKQGAFDYLEKPLEREKLLLSLKHAFERISLYRENMLLRRKLQEGREVSNIIGEHPKMQEIYRIISKIAPSNSTVLVSGESGTGKELVARAIHDLSPRQKKLFLAINCAAIPETLMESELFGYEKGAFTGAMHRQIGIFEAATGGTVFLDEIGEMSLNLQAKLLRVIQEREIRRVGGKVPVHVDVRVISATNRDLEEEVRSGRFREDLFYRLNVIRLPLPPLRERGNDVIALAEYFLQKYAKANGRRKIVISPSVLKRFSSYGWPGNVRQLESVIERCVLLSEKEVIEEDDLPLEVRQTGGTHGFLFELPPEGIFLEDLERQVIAQAMERAGWIISKAAPLLGITYKTLQYRLDKFGIVREMPE